MRSPSTMPTIAIRGAGDLATGVAVTLHEAGWRRIVMLERTEPLAVRRLVALSEAVHHDRATVEGVTAVLARGIPDVPGHWSRGEIPLLVDPHMASLAALGPDVLVDALIAKRNTGVDRSLASLVIGLGPGFSAGSDVHLVVETHRGHDIGRVIREGGAFPNTGRPGAIAGKTLERLLRAQTAGPFTTQRDIGDMVSEGDVVGLVGETPVIAGATGVLRGLVRSGTLATPGMKLGDVDPRGDPRRCTRISGKARDVGRGVLAAIRASFPRTRNDDYQAVKPGRMAWQSASR